MAIADNIFVAKNGVNSLGVILSSGVDLLDIIGTGGIPQTLSYNETNAQLSISYGNTVSLSSLTGSGEIDNYLPLSGGTVTGRLNVANTLSGTGTGYFSALRIGPSWDEEEVGIFPSSMASFHTSAYGRALIDIRNEDGGPESLTDLIITNDIGSEGAYFLDIGFTSSTYNQGVQFPIFPILGPNNAYMYASDADLLLGVAQPQYKMRFIVGGGSDQYEIFRLTTAGMSLNNLLSTNNIIKTTNSGSPQWTESYTFVNSNSAEWYVKDSILAANSATWSTAYSFVTANSAYIFSALTDLASASGKWDSTYTTVNANSANWDIQFVLPTNVTANTGNWNEAYTYSNTTSGKVFDNLTSLNSNSGSWNQAYTYSNSNSALIKDNLTALETTSGRWQSTYTTVNTNSGFWGDTGLPTNITANTGKWDEAYTYSNTSSGKIFDNLTSLNSNSGSWSQAYTYTNSNSSKINDNLTLLNGSSGSWSQAYTYSNSNSALIRDNLTSLETNSGRWESNYTTTNANSGSWSQAYTYSNSNSALIRDNLTSLESNSGSWSQAYTYSNSNSALIRDNLTSLESNSSRWESNYTTTNVNSAFWQSNYTTVNVNSGSWGQAYTYTNTNSARIDDDLTVLETNSASWGAGGTPQLLEYNEGNAQLTITLGNTISLSSLTGGGSGEYLPLSGGTVSGNVTVVGTISALSSFSGYFANPDGNVVVKPNSATGGVYIYNDLYWAREATQAPVEIGDLITFTPTMGLINGGALSANFIDLKLEVGEIVAYTMNNVPFATHELIKISTIGTPASARQLTLPANSNVYIYYNSSGTLVYNAVEPNTRTNVLLGRAITDSTAVIYLDKTPINAHHWSNYTDRMLREALGPVFSTGGLATSGTNPFTLNISAAVYFFSQTRITTTAQTPVTFDALYRSATPSIYNRTLNVTTIDNLYYDNGTGTLSAIPSNKYVKHTMYLDGTTSNFLLVYGQSVFDTQGLAEAAPVAIPPSYIEDSFVILCSTVVSPASSQIVSIIDERPRLGFVSSSRSGVIQSHGDLQNLLEDDHPQYLLVDGGRAMTGNLNLSADLNVLGNGTFYGSISALSGLTIFGETTFTSGSSLSVVNVGAGPALFVKQVGAVGDIASFYDTYNNEVLHIRAFDINGGRVGINEGEPQQELSVKGTISASNLVYAINGNSDLWNASYSYSNSNSSRINDNLTTLENNSGKWDSTYTTVNTNSGLWGGEFVLPTDVTANSGRWQTSYSTLTANSGSWSQAYTYSNANSAKISDNLTLLNTNSGKWDSTYTTVNTNSATWGTGSGSLPTDVTANSARWQTSYSTLTANSGLWDNAYTYSNNNSARINDNLTTVITNSGNWSQSYTTTNTNSGSWSQAYTYSNSNSGRINDNLTSLTTNSGKWDSTFTTVNSNSASWGTFVLPTDVTANSGRWQTSYSTLTANSGRWENAYTYSNDNSARINDNLTTVVTNSASWGQAFTITNTNSSRWESAYTYSNTNSAKISDNLTSLNTNSGRWESTYTTVNSNSASWGSAGLPTDVTANTGNWNQAYTYSNTNSARINDNLTTVVSNSANWGQAFTTTNTFSTNWDNAYSYSNSNSARINDNLTTLVSNSGQYEEAYTYSNSISSRIASNSSTLTANSGSWTEAYTTTNTNSAFWTARTIRSFTLEAPEAGDNVTCFYNGGATVSLSSIKAVVKGTTPSVNILLRYGLDRSAAGSNLVNQTTVNNTTNGQVLTLVTTTIPVDNYVWLSAGTLAGTTVNEINVTFTI